jgi:hypothetical protein
VTKRAVCIGTNYEGTTSQLAGCLNDAGDWAAELDRRGYEVTTLLGREASRAGILDALERGVGATEYRDQLIITYSGHGTWAPDWDKDEADGRDEAICPDDYSRAGLILDDDLYRVFAPAGHGERVVMLSDSCHSGSLNRLAGPVASPRRVRFLPPSLAGVDMDAARAVQHLPARGLMRRGALVMSACQASQVTYDISVSGRPCGLFTYVALEVLRALGDTPTYRDWHREVRRLLPSVDYPDVAPALDGTQTQKRWDALA